MSGLEKQLINSGSCSRPKYWKELTDTEKIERLREELKNSQRQLRNAVNLADRLLHIVYEHHHVNDKIMLPALQHNQYNQFGEAGQDMLRPSANPDEVYF